MAKHTSYDCKCKFNSATCNSNQKLNKKTCQYKCKNYRNWKNDYSQYRSTCIYENDKYLKSIADTLLITFNKIISVMDIASRKITNTIATNESINCHNKKVRCKIDCYILHTVLVVIILQLKIFAKLLFAIIMQNIGQNKKALMH